MVKQQQQLSRSQCCTHREPYQHAHKAPGMHTDNAPSTHSEREMHTQPQELAARPWGWAPSQTPTTSEGMAGTPLTGPPLRVNGSCQPGNEASCSGVSDHPSTHEVPASTAAGGGSGAAAVPGKEAGQKALREEPRSQCSGLLQLRPESCLGAPGAFC